jgi:hypothetical protein
MCFPLNVEEEEEAESSAGFCSDASPAPETTDGGGIKKGSFDCFFINAVGPSLTSGAVLQITLAALDQSLNAAVE